MAWRHDENKPSADWVHDGSRQFSLLSLKEAVGGSWAKWFSLKIG